MATRRGWRQRLQTQAVLRRVRHRLHHLEPRKTAGAARYRAGGAAPGNHAVVGDPKPFAPRIKSAGALLICQVQDEAMARQALDAGADVWLRRAPRRAATARPAPLSMCARDHRSCGRACRLLPRRHRRWTRLAAMMMLVRPVYCSARVFTRVSKPMGRTRRKAHLRGLQRQLRARHHLRSVTEQCLPAPFTGAA